MFVRGCANVNLYVSPSNNKKVMIIFLRRKLHSFELRKPETEMLTVYDERHHHQQAFSMIAKWKWGVSPVKNVAKQHAI